MTPIQDSRKINERVVFDNLQDKRQPQRPKYKLGQLVRTDDIKKVIQNRMQI